MAFEFRWDPKKAAANARKHGVTFDEATTAFTDPSSITIPDPDHSTGEERFILVGESRRHRLVVVAHTDADRVIRIISARRATRPERRFYEEDD